MLEFFGGMESLCYELCICIQNDSFHLFPNCWYVSPFLYRYYLFYYIKTNILSSLKINEQLLLHFELSVEGEKFGSELPTVPKLTMQKLFKDGRKCTRLIKQLYWVEFGKMSKKEKISYLPVE